MAFPNPAAIEQRNSPEVSRDGYYGYLTRVYQLPAGVTENDLVPQGYIPTTGYIDPSTGAQWIGFSFQDGHYPTLRVKFSKRLQEDATYDLHEATYPRPIEQHPDFLMNWKYGLWAKAGVSATPAWWSTATDESDTLGDAKDYRWSITNPGGLYVNLIKAPTKQGVESYFVSAPVIQKRKVYTDKAQSERWATEAGTLCLPFDTKGIGGDSGDWLIRDVRATEDGAAYPVTVEFVYASEGWDTDIYDTSSITDDGL